MLRRCLLLLTALLAFGARAEVINIDAAEAARLSAGGVPLVDVRTEGEWRDTGVVPGSRLITYFDEQGRSDASVWLEKLKPIAKPDQPVIVICRSGNRSQKVAQMLSQQAGYRTVYNVKEGVRGWAKEGRALTPATTAQVGCKPPRTC
ncbi:MAG: rhodanese-like domain-containing protein [Betaproteobacteria bacterium]